MHIVRERFSLQLSSVSSRPRSVKAKARTLGRSSGTGSQPSGVHFQRTRGLLCLTLALATVAVYARCLANDFINFDDRSYITENAHLRSGITPETLHWAFTTYYAGNWHPLTWLSHAFDVEAFGLNPAGHHSISVLLHAVNGVLVFLLLSCATGGQKIGTSSKSRISEFTYC